MFLNRVCGVSKGGMAMWLCRCLLCKTYLVLDSRYGRKFPADLSCGCLKKEKRKLKSLEQDKSLDKRREREKYNNLTGRRFGALLVVRREGTKQSWAAWLCQCDCGNMKILSTMQLKDPYTKSCGCFNKSRKTLKNMGLTSSNPIYASWSAMKNRCNSLSSIYYPTYGGRGIKVCDEWLDKNTGFMNFYNWCHKNSWEKGLHLDRIDNDKGYSPDNCRWVTSQENNRNRGISRRLPLNGYLYNLHDLCELSRCTPLPNTVWSRYRKGWSVADCLFFPVGLSKTSKKYKDNKDYYTNLVDSSYNNFITDCEHILLLKDRKII